MDLFALGIILFILKTGLPPFNQAHTSDTHYKLLITNRADLFWKSQAKLTKKTFSDEFMDLVTNMLQKEQAQRLTMADVIAHPWMQGECASI